MTNPIDDLLADISLAPKQKNAAATDSLMILKSERNKPGYKPDEIASLEREIQRASKQAGVPYDGGPSAPAPQVVKLNDELVNPLDELLVDMAPTAGAGRGTINPPTVNQPHPGRVNPNLTTVNLKDMRNRVAANPVVQGATHGFTAGLFDYLPAGMAYAYDRVSKKFTGDTTKPYSFKELLAAQRAQRNEVAAADPGQYMSGDIAGAVGLGYLTGGQSIPLTVLSQGTQGAVRKYTESPETTLEDAAKSGAVSAVIPVAVAGAGKVVVSPIVNQLQGIFMNKAAAAVIAAETAAGRTLTAAETQALYGTVLSELKAAPMFKALPGAVWQEVKSAILPGALGGAAGATTATLSGNDPMTGAQIGASGAVAATKLKVLGQAADAASIAAGRELVKRDVLLTDIGKRIPGVVSSVSQPVIPAAVEAATQKPAEPNPIDDLLGP